MPEATQTPKLTPKQRAFVEFFCGEARGNATKAARLAGYADPNQSGPANKVKKGISEEIARILSARTLSRDEVLDLLTQHAQGTLAHFAACEDGRVRIDLSTDDAQANFHLLKKLKTTESNRGRGPDTFVVIETEIELHDPQAAAVHLGRYHKLFTDRAEVTVTNTDPIAVRLERARLEGLDATELLRLHQESLGAARTDRG